MPYKLLKASDDSDHSEGESSGEEGSKEGEPAKAISDKPASPSHGKQEKQVEKSPEPARATTRDLFLKNEWTGVVLKALHRILQKVESHCGVSTQLNTADDASSDEEEEAADLRRKDIAASAKELRDATLEAWQQLTATIPQLDTAANYMMGMYLHTQAAPEEDFVVLLTRLPPFDVVLLQFINNMHDNKPALLKYWTLPLQRKEQVLADNLRVVLRQTVLPAMRRIKKDGTQEAVEGADEDSQVRVVYLDRAHPLSTSSA
jgi:hypothetical protein